MLWVLSKNPTRNEPILLMRVRLPCFCYAISKHSTKIASNVQHTSPKCFTEAKGNKLCLLKWACYCWFKGVWPRWRVVSLRGCHFEKFYRIILNYDELDLYIAYINISTKLLVLRNEIDCHYSVKSAIISTSHHFLTIQ